jgi:hypothetical protein
MHPRANEFVGGDVIVEVDPWTLDHASVVRGQMLSLLGSQFPVNKLVLNCFRPHYVDLVSRFRGLQNVDDSHLFAYPINSLAGMRACTSGS